MTSSSEILESARENLRLARIAATRASLPNAGWRWHSYCLNMRRQGQRFRTALEAVHFVQSPSIGAGFEARYYGDALVAHARLMEQTCRRILPRYADKMTTFAESDLSYPDTVVALEGRLVSSPLYNHIIHTLRCLEFSKPASVVEIGGGYGAPGRVWMTNGVHNPDLYVDIDFPESLFFAEIYLRLTLPEIEIVYLQPGQAMPAATPGKETIVLCPIAETATVLGQPLDLLVNTGSMQEMSDEYVDFYMKHIEASRIDRFYSANYFCQPLSDLKESMNVAAPVMGRDWESQLNSFLGSSPRGVAETYYLRSKGKTPDDKLEAAVREILAKGPPSHESEFLVLFDAVRRTPPSALWIEAAAAAIEGLPFVPKEAVYLLRKALEVSKENRAAAALLRQIEAQRDAGASGIVEQSVTWIRDELMAGRSIGDLPAGRFIERVNSTEIEINGAPAARRAGFGGVLEGKTQTGAMLRLVGWAIDRERNEIAQAIYMFQSGALVASVKPTIARPEFGLGTAPIGFELEIDSPAAGAAQLFAAFADGTLAWIDQPGVDPM